MNNYRFLGKARTGLFIGIFFATLSLCASPALAFAYNGSAAAGYAGYFCDKVSSDGYYWVIDTEGSSILWSYAPGTDVSVVQNDLNEKPGEWHDEDCAHFVSCCIGNPPIHSGYSGGGLDVPPRGGSYGEPGAKNLVSWLLGHGGIKVSSVSGLEEGDVIGYDTDGDGEINHVALYLGNDKVAAHSDYVCDEDWRLIYSSGFTFVHIGADVQIGAAIDIWLLDLIDQKAYLYFNPSWNLNINQFKAWLATIAWAEAGKAGYGAHSGGNPTSLTGDIFRHKTYGYGFHFSTGIGPFQLDRGSVDQWQLWPTGHKIDPEKAVISALKVHNQTFPSGYALTDFAWNSPWLAVNPNYTPGGASSNWAAVTGTDWVAHRAGPAPLDWPSIKSALAQNAAADPRSLYDYNVESKGLIRWNITAAENVRTETGRAVIFDGDFPTWLIRSRRHDETGSERCRYYYAFRSDLGPYPIEVWVYDNSQNPDRFKYIFIRECYPSATYGALPDHREIRPDGYAYAGETTLSAPAIIIGETLLVSLTVQPSSGTAPLNGVDLTASVSGTDTGTINYTFYANRSDDGTNITPDYCFKIDNVNPDGTGGDVRYRGIATKWGGSPFTVYDVYNYASAGTYTAKVIAERGDCQAEDRFTITVNPPTDTTKPTVTITSPTSNPTYSTSSSPLSIGGTASDNVGVTQVTWSNDRGGSGTCSGTTSWSASGITLYSGQNVITVTARDAADNTGTGTLTVTYTPPDTNQPTVSISSPTGGETFTTSPITVTGTASDPGSPSSGVALVEVRVNGGSWQTAIGTTSWNRLVSLTSGSNTIEARSRDNAGNYSTIASVSVTYTPPEPPPDELWKSPTATGKSDNEWTNPTYAYSSDDNYATVAGTYLEQDYYNFNFGLPSGATPTGIQVKIEGHGYLDGEGYYRDSRVLVYIWSASSSSWGRQVGAGWWAFALNGDETLTKPDGTADLWGTSGLSDFDNANFKLRIQTFSSPYLTYIDHIQARVYYTEPPFTITASAGPGGSINPSGTTQVASGGSQTYTITANAGYHISDVLVDGISVGAVTSYSFTNVTANHTIAATFTESEPYHPADTDSDYVISMLEILACIDQWAVGNVSMLEVLEGIDLWAAGHYYWDESEQKFKPGERP